MKKIVSLILATFFTLFCFASCNKDENTILVGESSTPHALILEQVKADLKAQGYNLKIRIMDDYVTPNTALESGDIDANYFQHEPYLVDFNSKNGTHLVSVAKIHYEPLAIYSTTQSKTGLNIVIPNDGSNCTRALFLLQTEGYITLKSGVLPTDTLSDLDIADKKGNTVSLVEASTVPAQYRNGNQNTIAVVNGNYALSANLPKTEISAIESGATKDTYANLIAVKEGHENDAKIQALVNALKTQKVYDYITSTFGGSVLPTFEI